ncbi:YfbU family protein [Bacillus subtilis]|uniref:YfbU family protein n=1 Tax=Bacillus subtilis TaxID=1423 RepID=UPI00345B871B
MTLHFTKEQRAILINQLEIKQLLDESRKDLYEKYIEILDRGYSRYYSDIFGELDEELDDTVHKRVVGVLTMYETLYNDRLHLPEEEKKQIDEKDVLFKGFDGNNESSHHSYVNFLVRKMEMFSTIGELIETGKIKSTNSHRSMVGYYDELLQRYRSVTEKNNKSFKDRLTLEQFKEVLGK